MDNVNHYDLLTLDTEAQGANSNLTSEIEILKDKVQDLTCRGTCLKRISGHYNNQDFPESGQQILEAFHLLQSQDYITKEWSDSGAVSNLSQIIDHLGHLQSRLNSEEVSIYKRECQLIESGLNASNCKPTKSIEGLQLLMENLLHIHLTLKDYMSKLMQKHFNDTLVLGNLQHTGNTLYHLMTKLLCSSLIVDKQPPQVVLKSKEFPQKLRLKFLLGMKLQSRLGAKAMCSNKVKASVITEAQAKDLHLANCTINLKPSGILSNDTAKLEFSKDASNYIFGFKNVKLESIDREIKKVKGQQASCPSFSKLQTSQSSSSSAYVTREKFAIVFQMDLKMEQETYHIWSLSLPVVVVTHVGQDSQALATIIWDNYFSSSNRLPFQVPEWVQWSSLAELLSLKCNSITGRSLDERQLCVLRRKLLPKFQAQSSDIITFDQFSNKEEGSCSASFWVWFHNALKVVEKHAASHWRNGSIFGFIERADAEKLLEGCQPGTFLLRFSDTVTGGISICYVASNGKAFSLTPFTTKNLTFRSLTDSLWDLDNLTTCYPNVPKNKAFPICKHVVNKAKLIVGNNASVCSDCGLTPSTTTPSKPRSDYVSSYPKISIPHQYL